MYRNSQVVAINNELLAHQRFRIIRQQESRPNLLILLGQADCHSPKVVFKS